MITWDDLLENVTGWGYDITFSYEHGHRYDFRINYEDKPDVTLHGLSRTDMEELDRKLHLKYTYIKRLSKFLGGY